MVPRENKNNAYAKFGGTNKKYYCLFPKWPILKLVSTIVNRGDWFGSSANIKGANKDAKISVEKSTTVHNLLFCAHTLCMNYVTNTFLVVRFLSRE